MSDRFHNKFHKYNHHTDSTTGVPDSASDPIASPTHPFQGDFHLNATLSANNIISNDEITGETGTFNNNLIVNGPGNMEKLFFIDPPYNGINWDWHIDVDAGSLVFNNGPGPSITGTPLILFSDNDVQLGNDALSNVNIVSPTTISQDFNFDEAYGNFLAAETLSAQNIIIDIFSVVQLSAQQADIDNLYADNSTLDFAEINDVEINGGIFHDLSGNDCFINNLSSYNIDIVPRDGSTDNWVIQDSSAAGVSVFDISTDGDTWFQFVWDSFVGTRSTKFFNSNVGIGFSGSQTPGALLHVKGQSIFENYVSVNTTISAADFEGTNANIDSITTDSATVNNVLSFNNTGSIQDMSFADATTSRETLRVGQRGNLVYVDATYGSNSTGQRNREDLPFADLMEAKANSQVGDTIVVRPGSYVIPSFSTAGNLGKNGVNWYFEAGAEVTVDESTVTHQDKRIIFGEEFSGGSPIATEYQVKGYGDFIINSTASPGSEENHGLVYSNHTDSKIDIECNSFVMQVSGTNMVGRAIQNFRIGSSSSFHGGEIKVKINYLQSNDNIGYIDAGTTMIDCPYTVGTGETLFNMASGTNDAKLIINSGQYVNNGDNVTTATIINYAGSTNTNKTLIVGSGTSFVLPSNADSAVDTDTDPQNIKLYGTCVSNKPLNVNITPLIGSFVESTDVEDFGFANITV